MFDTPFYNGHLKKVVVAFGNIFSNIKIARENNAGIVTKTIAVPIAYASKDKAITRTDADPTLENQTKITLPRLSFEIAGYNYDSVRKVNRMSKIICQKDDGTRTSMFSPAPYNVDINLYLITKNTEDAFQVVEQILPIFTPEYSVSIKAVPSFNVIDNVSFILNEVSIDDEYEGSFENTRLIIHTFNFTAKMSFFSESTSQGLIKIVDVNITDNPSESYHAEGTIPGNPITESWTFKEY